MKSASNSNQISRVTLNSTDLNNKHILFPLKNLPLFGIWQNLDLGNLEMLSHFPLGSLMHHTPPKPSLWLSFQDELRCLSPPLTSSTPELLLIPQAGFVILTQSSHGFQKRKIYFLKCKSSKITYLLQTSQ